MHKKPLSRAVGHERSPFLLTSILMSSAAAERCGPILRTRTWSDVAGAGIFEAAGGVTALCPVEMLDGPDWVERRVWRDVIVG